MSTKIAFITGASAGIGKACAEIFAQNGYRLILAARRIEKLEKFAQELETECLCIELDVRDQNSVQKAIDGLTPEWHDIDVLINNAGLAAGMSPIQSGDLDHWERMIDTNVKGLLYVSRAVLPLMISRNTGHVFNVASLAGKEVYPNGNVYCATKHAVDALSKGMRLDLLPHHIKVTNIAPGLVETEFSIVRFDQDEEKAKKVYDGYQPLKASDIADCIWFAASRPYHVNIADMLILPAAQANSVNVRKNA